jgi:cobalt-zinc-cadmium efflux system outer membrane protein
MERHTFALTGLVILLAAGCANPPVEIPARSALPPLTRGRPTAGPVLLVGEGPSPTTPTGAEHIEGVLPAQHCSRDGNPPFAAELQLTGAHPIDFYVRGALARNPEIRAAERRVAALEAVIPQATALPDPTLSNTVWPSSSNSFQTAAGRQANSLTLAQQFPWFGKLRLRGAVAAAEARIALTRVAETQLKVIEAVKTAYYEIYFNDQAIRITEESEKFLRDYIRAAEARYTVGQVSQQDVLLAQVELRRLEDQLVQYRKQRGVAQADLAKLLATSPKADLQVAEDSLNLNVPTQMDQLYQAALAYRPELQGRLEAIFRDEQVVGLARLNYYPDVTVGLNWSVITRNDALARLTANGNDNLGLLVGINLPIWKDKLAGGVDEAQNRVAESARLYENARDDTFRAIRRLTVQARALQEEIDLYRRKGTGILASAEQTLDVSFADYKTGKVDSLTVLSNYTQLLSFQIQVVRLEAALGEVLASLERAVGNRLTRAEEEGSAPGVEELPPPLRADRK